MKIPEEQWERLRQWCRDHPIEHKVVMTTLPKQSHPMLIEPYMHGIYPDFPRFEFVTIKERKSKPEDSKYVFDLNGFRKLWDEPSFEEKDKNEGVSNNSQRKEVS